MQFVPREIDGNILVLEADGGLDASNSSSFAEDVLALVDGGIRRLIIDCSGLTHISSLGVGALIRLHARVRKLGGDVKFCSVGGVSMQVLHVMRLDRVFEIYPDLGQARLAFTDPV